jgi:hypothetical protein
MQRNCVVEEDAKLRRELTDVKKFLIESEEECGRLLSAEIPIKYLGMVTSVSARAAVRAIDLGHVDGDGRRLICTDFMCCMHRMMSGRCATPSPPPHRSTRSRTPSTPSYGTHSSTLST